MGHMKQVLEENVMISRKCQEIKKYNCFAKYCCAAINQPQQRENKKVDDAETKTKKNVSEISNFW